MFGRQALHCIRTHHTGLFLCWFSIRPGLPHSECRLRELSRSVLDRGAAGWGSAASSIKVTFLFGQGDRIRVILNAPGKQYNPQLSILRLKKKEKTKKNVFSILLQNGFEFLNGNIIIWVNLTFYGNCGAILYFEINMHCMFLLIKHDFKTMYKKCYLAVSRV